MSLLLSAFQPLHRKWDCDMCIKSRQIMTWKVHISFLIGLIQVEPNEAALNPVVHQVPSSLLSSRARLSSSSPSKSRLGAMIPHRTGSFTDLRAHLIRLDFGLQCPQNSCSPNIIRNGIISLLQGLCPVLQTWLQTVAHYAWAFSFPFDSTLHTGPDVFHMRVLCV